MLYIIFCRVFELMLSKKNTQKLIEEGAREYYKSHYKYIVIFHIFFIIYFLLESLNNSTIIKEYLYIFFLVQIFRYKVIFDLGKFWTTRIIVINKPLIMTWQFKYLRHPNYIIVFLEISLVCLLFDDFMALYVFSFINLVLICVRIYFEEKANKNRRKI